MIRLKQKWEQFIRTLTFPTKGKLVDFVMANNCGVNSYIRLLQIYGDNLTLV